MSLAPSLSTLPTELKHLIATHLRPPPTTSIPQLPAPLHQHLPLSSAPLKSLSLVCHDWRTLLRPLLLSRILIRLTPPPGANSSPTTRLRLALNATAALLLALDLHLPARVASLSVSVAPGFADERGLRNPAQHSTDLITMHDFWRVVLRRFDPLRLAVVAPPCVLGWLTTSVPAMEDGWAFPDMGLQMLELERDEGMMEREIEAEIGETSGWDTQYLFCAKPWTKVRLVEGSMMQAYGVYEYFHKRPPTVLGGLVIPRSERITSFGDHVLFPFSTHIDQLQLSCLSAYQHVHFHFSPAPNERVLDDAAMVGKTDLSDCWREMEQLYKRIVSFQPPSSLFSHGTVFRKFSTGDYTVPSIRELLDAEFDLHAAAGWRSTSAGSWTLFPA